MGLDSIELVMAVEETFGVSIPDEEAQDIRTVGDMFQCVISKLMVAEGSSCLTQKAFHLLRRKAKDLFNVPRNQFRLDAELDLIVPKHSRRENWRRFQLAVGATKWPRLALSWPGVLTVLALLLAIPGSVFLYSTAVLRWNMVEAFAIALVFVVVAIQAGKFVVRPFEIAFRGGISTVRDLAYVVVAQNAELFGIERATWTNDETWSLLSSVIREQTGVTQFTKDSRFVEDLKID
jgi:hypothetical protein